MHFVLTADAVFDAEDLDDALAKLADHFLALLLDNDRPSMFSYGSVRVARQ